MTTGGAEDFYENLRAIARRELAIVLARERPDRMLALDLALQQLEERDERQARVVECRYFAGMTVEETGAALGISPATVKRDWTLARAWLNRELGRA